MKWEVRSLKIEAILGIESRGFIFGATLARELGVGFVPVRKINKLLPRKTVEQTYDLEYGKDGVKIHADSVQPGQRVLIVERSLLFYSSTNFAIFIPERH